MADVVMPRLSDSMEEGTVLAWMKSVGDEVAVGDELVEIETDKANMVYEADVAGTLTEILAEEGATLPIGEVIARVGDEGAAAGEEAPAERGARSEERGAETDGTGSSERSEHAPRAERGEAERAPSERSEPAPRSPDGEAGRDRVKASPLARRMASERGVELTASERLGTGRANRQGRRRAGRGPGDRPLRHPQPQPPARRPAPPNDRRPPAAAPARSS